MKKVVSLVLATVCFSTLVASAQPKRTYSGVILSSARKLDDTLHSSTLQRERLSATSIHFAGVSKMVDSPKEYTRSSSLCRKAKIRNIQKAAKGRVRCTPNFEVRTTEEPNDQYYSLQYSHKLMSMPYAWDKQKGNSELLALVIDTGIAVNHPDLKSNMWVNPREIPNNYVDDDNNGYIDDVNGMNAITNVGSGADDNGHGTHVAGIIGADANNYIGVAGVAHKLKLVSLKFLSSTGSGSTANAIKAINYGIQLKLAGHKVVVMNNSYGSSLFSKPFLDAVRLARDHDILFVAAAGNNGTNTDVTPFYPASYDSDNVISVGSVDSSAAYNSFSNYGVSSVDVAAPGGGICSTVFSGSYGYKSGTSMAAPQVSGLAILAKAQCSLLDSTSLKTHIANSVAKFPNLSMRVASGGVVNGIGMLDSVIQGCSTIQPTPIAVAPTPAETPQQTVTATPTATPTYTHTPTATATATPTPTPTPSPRVGFLSSVLVPNRTVDFEVAGSPQRLSHVQFQLKLSNGTFHSCINTPVKLTSGARAYKITLPSTLTFFPTVRVLLKAPGVVAQSSVAVKSTGGTISRPQANAVCARMNAQLDW